MIFATYLGILGPFWNNFGQHEPILGQLGAIVALPWPILALSWRNFSLTYRFCYDLGYDKGAKIIDFPLVPNFLAGADAYFFC